MKSESGITRRRFVALSFLGLMMTAVSATVMGPAFPSIRDELGVPLGALGFLASAWNMGYLLTILGGILSDRYGEPLILCMGFILGGTAAGLAAVAPNYQALALSFLLAGIGAAFGEASMNPLVSRLYPHKSGFALNILHIFWSIGAFIGPALAGLLIIKYGNWRLPYWAICLAFMPLIVTSLTSVRRMSPERGGLKLKLGDVAEVGGLKTLGALILLGFLYLSVELGVNAWLPSFLLLERGFPMALASLSISLFWAFMAVGRLILGGFADRIGYGRLILTASVLGSTSILAGILEREIHLVMGLWALSGLMFGPIFPTILAWANRLFPSRRGLASGSIFSIGILGGVFSPWFIGVMAELYTLKIFALYVSFSGFLIGLSTLFLGSTPIKSSV
ncbi:MAG: MFS transporter [Candidatus Bathyarchaeia archaeon]